MRPLASRGVSPRLRGLALVAALGLLCACSASAAVTLELAQTHVFPAPRREWKDAGLKPKLADVDLHLVGERDVLAIVEFGNQVTSSPKLFVSNDRTGANAAEVALRSPDHMPDTQGDAVELYSHTAWTAKIPGELVTRGMQIFVEWAEGEKTWSDITVGAPTPFELVSLPLYFFGAHPDDTKDGLGHPLTPELAGRMPTSVEAEYRERLPISRFHTRLHPARFFRSDHAVVGPRLGGPAYRLSRKEDARDGFAVLSSVMQIMAAIRDMDGAKPLATQYYGSLLQHDAEGKYAGPGGGLGGGGVGAGDYSFGGVFFHEAGHAFGLPHAADAYDSGSYPYPRGSLKGSGWGYDAVAGHLVDPFFHRCAPEGSSGRKNRELEDAPPGASEPFSPRCYKQDPMQGGHQDRDRNQYYGIFSDFQCALIQRYFEGETLEKGRAFRDEKGDGFVRWDPALGEFAPATLSAVDVAQVTGAELTAAVFTVSCAELGCEASASASGASLAPGALRTGAANLEATQVYPPLSYRGDAKEFVDVDNPYTLDRYHYERARMDGRDERKYCETGCDFIARFEFANGEEARVMVPGSFRPYTRPTAPPAAEATDPLSAKSFRTVGVAVPGVDAVRVDLMYAPRAWEGVHARVPQLLASWTKERGAVAAPTSASFGEAPAARHAAAFDLAIAVPSDANHCAMDRGLPFVRALEEAMFEHLGGNDRLPELSSARVACACAGATCAEGCERTYQYPLPELSAARSGARAAALGDASGSAPALWTPECGCEFEHFDGDATCSGGATHVSALRKVWSTEVPGAYYFADANGEGMMAQESTAITDGWEWLYDTDLAGAVETCRSRRDCAMAQFEVSHSRNKTKLLSSRCASPCYVKDYWGRVGYHVDASAAPSAWASPAAEREPSGSSRVVTVRFEVHVPTDAGAAAARAT